MSEKIDLRGKSREDLDALTRSWRRARFLDALYELANLEPFFSPEMVGQARGMKARAIVALCKAGVIRAHKPFYNGFRIPRSAVLEWDARTALSQMPEPRMQVLDDQQREDAA